MNKRNFVSSISQKREKDSLHHFIKGMPKTELHLHIEGTLEPELAFTLAKKNDVTLRKTDGTPFKSAKELKKAYNFNNLQEFLDIYYQGMSVLNTEQDFYDLTYAYLKKVSSQNVKHAEIFFDPQGHTERDIAFSTVIKGIHRALEDGKETLGINSKLILSFLRHKSEEDAFKTLDEAKPYLDMIDGFGLDSSEKDFPPHLFERVYKEAGKNGKFLTAHAGEEGPADYVIEALDLLKVSRIDHGNHALDNPTLVNRLAKEKIGLTVCPLSNLKLCVIKDMKDHPLRAMLNKELKVNINSDDPAYFGGYINENYLAIADALKLTRDDIIQLARNGIDISNLSAKEKAVQHQTLDDYITKASHKNNRVSLSDVSITRT